MKRLQAKGGTAPPWQRNGKRGAGTAPKTRARLGRRLIVAKAVEDFRSPRHFTTTDAIGRCADSPPVNLRNPCGIGF